MEAGAKSKASEEDLSMEEILQSIRNIIAEDGEEKPETANDKAEESSASDVLELTEMVEEPAEEAPAAQELIAEDMVEEPAAEPEAPAADENDVLNKIDQTVVADKPAATPKTEAPAKPEGKSVEEEAYINSLLSKDAASKTAAAFKKALPPEAPIVTTPSAQFRSGASVEDLVMESLKPMLKDWLDKNLPNIVERLVEREIKKLAD